jgi:selenoprotein W-related protein
MQEFGVDSTLTPGGGGVFDVIIDGKTLFSKKSIGRFPETGEIVSMLQKR